MREAWPEQLCSCMRFTRKLVGVRKTDWSTLSVDAGKYSGGTIQAQTFIILHELAHGVLRYGHPE